MQTDIRQNQQTSLSTNYLILNHKLLLSNKKYSHKYYATECRRCEGGGANILVCEANGSFLCSV